MTDNDQPPAVPAPHINFEAPAVLRKWPSLNNQRRTEELSLNFGDGRAGQAAAVMG